MKLGYTYLLSMLLMANAGMVSAQQGSIKLQSQAFKEVEVVSADGKKEYKLVEPATVLPKDEILYVTTFTNIGQEPANKIIITNPVPNSSVYKAGSAFGSGMQITFSVDGGNAYAAPAELTVTQDGVNRPAKPEEYTHIRWTFQGELAPQAEGNVTFRTVITGKSDLE